MKNGLLLLVMSLGLFACRRDNVLEQNQWGTIFKNQGIDSACFELSDNSHDQILLYNLHRCSQRYSPASTFKIVNSLIALETNIAKDEKLMIPWDGQIRRESWNKDMNMREAFEVSCTLLSGIGAAYWTHRNATMDRYDSLWQQTHRRSD
ncbi:MAG: hypothetical protein IPN26_10735 [Bacteroidetes bacterium]|nr:hypothetical protein [Bacteroidota bacterium]